MLYFAYSGMMDPELLETVAPQANFQFIAHLPETRLAFPTTDGSPSIQAAPGNTVWGAVFEVSNTELKSIAAHEASFGQKPLKDIKAVDRSGNKYPVAAFAYPANSERNRPSVDHMRQVVSGARHWHLPTGWVAGLEDLSEDDL
ncbi:MAG: gamma-glutamylcyclotransferase family protein [Acidimicrobiia bacterium]